MADVARSVHMQLSLAATQSSSAALAGRLTVCISPRLGANSRQPRSCTFACTDHRSIKQHERQRCTAVHTHSYLHLTCCVCRSIQICSDCRRGRRSFQSAFCSMGDVRALWLHPATSPGGRAYMPRMQLLRNERCSRKAAIEQFLCHRPSKRCRGIKQTHEYMFIHFYNCIGRVKLAR